MASALAYQAMTQYKMGWLMGQEAILALLVCPYQNDGCSAQAHSMCRAGLTYRMRIREPMASTAGERHLECSCGSPFW